MNELLGLYDLAPANVRDASMNRNENIIGEFLLVKEKLSKDAFLGMATRDDNDIQVVSEDRIADLLRALFPGNDGYRIMRKMDEEGQEENLFKQIEGRDLVNDLAREFKANDERKAFEYQEFIDFLHFLGSKTELFTFHGEKLKDMKPMPSGIELERSQTFANEPPRDDAVSGLRNEIARMLIIYEDRLENCQNDDERRILQNMIAPLRGQLADIDKRYNGGKTSVMTVQSVEAAQKIPMKLSPKKVFKKEQTRESSLKEIYEFYATEQMLIGKNSTFDHIQSASQLWNMGKMFIFLKDFDLFNKGLTRAVKILLYDANSYLMPIESSGVL